MDKDKSKRSPTQKRSIERVESILSAAKSLIGEKGSAGLKIQEIAERAGVTAGSMYQYFPNKAAIIKALAEEFMEEVSGMLEENMPEFTSKEEYVSASKTIFKQYYLRHAEEPVLRDILISTTVDKSLIDMDVEYSRRHAEVIFRKIKGLVSKEEHEALRKYLFWVMHVSGATVQLALKLPDDEGLKMVEMATEVLTSRFLDDFI